MNTVNTLHLLSTMENSIFIRTQKLIDELKAICAAYGLGNDGNEYKVITQVFQYKYLNDKFMRYAAMNNPETSASPYDGIMAMEDEAFGELQYMRPSNIAWFKKEQLIPSLHNRQSEPNFDKLFDDTLTALAAQNAEIFSVRTSAERTSILMFEPLSVFITDAGKRADFCRAIINKLSQFSFEDAFDQGYDFYSAIYEYLIRDYNTDSGGKYAEYFTPHSVGRVMAQILVDGDPKSVTCYDPSAGSGTLLMCLADRIGQRRCTIYSQDISQKSSGLLRLNLILNGMVDSLQNVVQGNTLTEPGFAEDTGGLQKFDYIVSNPPFKLDFSEYRDQLDTRERKYIYFAGVPKVPNKKRESMAIYLCFLQHVIASLGDNGKAAVVVPSGFLTAGLQSDRIAYTIRKQLVETKWLRGVVSMPPNIFAATGTSVSVIFIDKEGANERESAILIDASQLGTKEKDNNNKQYTRLSHEEEERIIDAFKRHQAVNSFAVVPSYDEMREKSYSFSAGQYFEVRIEHVDITPGEFKQKLYAFMDEFTELTEQSVKLDEEIKNQMKNLLYE